MNYYKKNNSYIASDLTLDLPVATKAKYESFVAAQAQKHTILAQLTQLDQKALRPLRAIAAGTASDEDKAILAHLEEQASDLRKQIQ